MSLLICDDIGLVSLLFRCLLSSTIVCSNFIGFLVSRILLPSLYTSEMHSIVGASVSEGLDMFMVYICVQGKIVKKKLEINVAYATTKL